MTPAGPTLRAVIDGIRRTLRRDAAITVAAALMCALPALLLLTWLSGLVRPWSRPGVGPLVVDLLLLAAVAAGAWYGVRRFVGGIDENAVAADAERRAGMSQGTVRGVLELLRELPEGTSPALARRAESAVGRHFAGLSPAQVSGELASRVRQRRRTALATLGILTFTVLLAAFAAPDHSRAAWAPLAQPLASLTPPPLPPLQVRPGNVTVSRGSPVAVHIEAPGRTVVTLRWRIQGDVTREQMATVGGDSAVASIPRVDAPGEYWVEAPDGAVTARYRITPVDPLLLSDLSIDVVYPAYVGRAAERYTGEAPALELPEGTQLVITGRATRRLGVAQLNGAVEPPIGFRIDDAGFTGTFTPAVSGIYQWRLRDGSGADVSVQPAPLHISIVRDAAPLVEIAYPLGDTLLDASRRQAVVADARDDFGLVSAAVVSWRVGRDGGRENVREDAITLSGDDRALIRSVLDASDRDLVPGDVVRFFVRVTDNSPRRQSAESRTLSLRLPTMRELRERSADDAEDLVDAASAMAKAAAQLQQETRALERQTSAANARRRAAAEQSAASRSSPTDGRPSMDFNEAARARQTLERHEEMHERLETMRRNIDALERSMEESGMKDAELQERLAELRKLYDQMLTPEAKQQLEQLRQAVESMDPEALQKALEAMAAQQEQLKEQIEQSLELMRRAAAEQEMNSLAQEARELATQQQALSQAMSEGKPTPEQARQQEELAQRAQELARELAEVQQRLQEHGEQQASERTQDAQQQAEQAARQMSQAAADAQKQSGESARQKGEQAAQQMEKAADALEQARQAMADGRRQEAEDSMQQATSDALSLAQRQQQLLDQMKQAEVQARGQQPGQQQQGQQQQGQQGQQQQGQQGQQQQGQQGQQGQQQGGQQQAQQGQQQGQQGQQGQQQGGQQQGQQGQQQGQQGQPGGQQAGGQQGQSQQPGGQSGQGQQGQTGQGSGESQGMRSEQAALQQGLQQLSRNLQETAQRSGAVNRDVANSLARANMSMQQTLEALQRGEMPVQQAQQTVDALNRLALSLLNNSQQAGGQESGTGSPTPGQELANLATRQASVNGQASSMSPMNLSAGSMAQQLDRLAQEQLEIAQRLGGLNQGGREAGMAEEFDAMAREAEALARQLRSGAGLPPDVLARQERMFHRLLDAGRSLEKEEYEDQRTGERPGRLTPRDVEALDRRLFENATRFPAPTAEELQALPPAQRRLILDYFERLNRPLPPLPASGSGR